MVLSDGPGDIGWKKYLIASWAFVECLLFAGTLYGWSSLVFVLKDEGIYSYLCDSQKEELSDISNNSLSHTGNESSNSFNYSVINDNSNYMVTTSPIYFNDSIQVNTNITDNVQFTKIGRACKGQDSQMSLCFTISSAVFCASCVVMGHVNFKLGTRITRLIAFAFFISGSLCFAFVNKDLPWLITPALSFIGIGGLSILVTNTQVSNLFTKGSSSVVGLLCGGYDMSSAVFLVVKIAYQKGLSRQNSYFILTALYSMTLVSTFFFLPKSFIQQRMTTVNKDVTITAEGAMSRLLEKDDNFNSRRTSRRMSRRPSLADKQTLSSYIRQPLFITHNIWLCLLQLRFYFFIGNLNTYLNKVLNEDKHLVSYFTNMCYYFMMGGLLTSFLTGIVYDWQKRVFKKGHTKLYRDVMPAVLPLTIASVLSILMSVLVLFPLQPVMYIIFIIMTLYRSFLYSMAVAFLSAIFPSQYFAVVYGITMVMAGVFSCFQYAFFTWSEAYELGQFHADICLLVVSVISLGHPAYMWFSCWRVERAAITEL